MLFDSHCHLFDEQFADDLDAVLERARSANVRRVVVPGVDLATSEQAIALAEHQEEVYAAVGIHPEAAKAVPEQDFRRVEALTAHPKVVAVGEIGLDYYWDAAPRQAQQDVMRRQLEIARVCKLPVIIHNRDATEDVVALLERFAGQVVGVMHCFNADLETAQRCIELGFFISFGGPLTFKNAPDVRDVAAAIPDQWLLAETDSPYLSPAPFRGKRNEPERVRLVVEKLAEVRGQTVTEVEQITVRNTMRLFGKVKPL